MGRQITKLVHTLGKISLCFISWFVIWLMITFSLMIASWVAFITALLASLIISILTVWELMTVIEIAIRWKR